MKSSLNPRKSSSKKRKSSIDTNQIPHKKMTKLACVTSPAVIDQEDYEKARLKLCKNTAILPTPVKSESDKKEYRLIRLSNGLTALLVDSTHAIPLSTVKDADDTTSEEESEASSSEEEASSDDEEDVISTATGDDDENLAACSLMIDVGSFSDPRHIQGLAHFLEHIIFMGSEKYPAENEFDCYINRSGGSDNADTDCEETSFYFEVTEKALEGGLDRFSQLFIAPLMSRDAMDREREAVDSEFQTKINQDGTRREQLLGK